MRPKLVSGVLSPVALFHKQRLSVLELDPNSLSEMLRARMLTEMQRDIFYVSTDYERSYDARGQKMRRPEDENDVLTEWRGFVQQAGMSDAGLVGTLPQVGSGLRASRDAETP